MADQIATRYGILPEDISRAALQTIVLAAADAIDALEEAHQWLQRVGVPDDHAGQLSPRQRWEQLLRNLFPASILVIDPRGSASPDLAELPPVSDEVERAVSRLLNAAASFLLSQATTVDDALELGRHWGGVTTVGEASIENVEALLLRVSRASRTLLDHAESGAWRGLLATFVKTPAAPVPAADEPRSLQPRQHTIVATDVEKSSERRLFTWAGETAAGKSSLLGWVVILADYSDSLMLPVHNWNYDAVWPVRSRWRTARGGWPANLHDSHSAVIKRFDRWCAEALGDLCVTRTNLDPDEMPAVMDGALRLAAFERLRARGAAHHITRGSYGCSETGRQRYEQLWGDLCPRHNLVDAPGASGFWVVDYGLSPSSDLPSPNSPSDMFPLRFPPPPLTGSPGTFTGLQSLLLAAELLVDDDVNAKLRGLSQVRAFGNANPEHRQLVVNVLCGYLRTPAPGLGRDTDEWLVRAEVQATLAERLRPDPDHPPDDSWEGMDLDLNNAVLVDLNLTGCRIRSARFTGARFYGDTVFTAVRIGCSLFDRAVFAGQAVFEHVTFADEVRFDQTSFDGDAVFRAAQFDRDGRFDAARFAADVVFTDSVFSGDARFVDTEFCGDAVFDQARFSGLVRFGHARFFAGARFLETWFHRGHDGNPARDLDAVLLARDPGWVRTDTPTKQPRRVWPEGWTVRPTHDQPHGEDEGQWGRLVPELPTAV